MNLVDSSGWLEFFIGGQNAGYFAPPIGDSEHLLIPTICVHEVFKRILSEFGESQALDAIGAMSLGTIIDLDRQIAIEAAQLSIKWKLAMADSIILASAHAYDAILWTQDEHFASLPGVRFIHR